LSRSGLAAAQPTYSAAGTSRGGAGGRGKGVKGTGEEISTLVSKK